MNFAKQLALDLLNDVLSFLGGSFDSALVEKNLEMSPQWEWGHFAFPCFFLAKELKKPPFEIAQILALYLEEKDLIFKVESRGPYVNFFLRSGSLCHFLLEQIDLTSFSWKPFIQKHPLTYLVEHSQPNTHKVLHIGHARNSVLGDNISRFLRFQGHSVIEESYLGDEGLHIAKCLWYLEKEKIKPDQDEEKGTWLGNVYVRANQAFQEEVEKNTEQMKEVLSKILSELEDQSGFYFDLWKETREWSLELFNSFFRWLDVSFDRHSSESGVSKLSLELVKDLFEKGYLIQSEGAVGLDLKDQGLGFMLFLKSDGRGLYATKDLALAHQRFQELHLDRCLYVVDQRQSHHFQQLFASLKTLGYLHGETCHHMAYEMVETKAGPMSSRLGNVVPFEHLKNQMEAKALLLMEERSGHRHDSQEALQKSAQQIALGCIRYGMIRIDPSRKIVFDLEDWLSFEGNTGPYLQYVYARLCSLQRQAGEKEVLARDWAWDELKALEEGHLIIHLCAFPEVVNEACDKLRPDLLAHYAYELGKRFNAFYKAHPINRESCGELRRVRQGLVAFVKGVLGTSLDLMGIPKLEKM